MLLSTTRTALLPAARRGLRAQATRWHQLQAEGESGKAVIVAIARKLAIAPYSMLASSTDYRSEAAT